MRRAVSCGGAPGGGISFSMSFSRFAGSLLAGDMAGSFHKDNFMNN
jgi:hypothetical protein